MKNFALVLLALLMLAGCGDDKKKAGGSRVPGPSDGQIAYARDGGFIGVQDRLDIRPDGASRASTRAASKRFQLSAAERDEFAQRLKAADLASLKTDYKPKYTVADGFEYSITYAGRTIKWGDGGDAPPRGLTDLSAFLSGLVQRHAG